MRKILFSRESECIRPLKRLVEEQTHKTLVLWVFDCAPRFLELFETYRPDDSRPRDAISAGQLWARGEVKMPFAKRAIHAAHSAAAQAEEFPPAQAAARAVGHAAATVHVETHALGVVFYGLTALVYEHKPEHVDAFVRKECDWFFEKLKFRANNPPAESMTWAPFLMKDIMPNKEALLGLKEKQKREDSAKLK